MARHVLDNPVWAALAGPHAHHAQTHGAAMMYPADVAPFAAFDDGAWHDLAELAGPAGVVAVVGLRPPPDWEIMAEIPAVQMVATSFVTATDTEAVELGPADVPEMLDLVERTKPGPFRPRTIELGRYLGIRRGGALVAMAGERIHPPGWSELSAVCTDP